MLPLRSLDLRGRGETEEGTPAQSCFYFHSTNAKREPWAKMGGVPGTGRVPGLESAVPTEPRGVLTV